MLKNTILLLSFLFFFGVVSSEEIVLKIDTLIIAEDTIIIEIADTPETRRQGLSDRKVLPENHGMLFVFPQADQRTFWMYHCYLSLDAAFIDKNGVIRQIIHMLKEPYQTPVNKLKRYSSNSYQIKYVLEINLGWFNQHAISKGDSLELIHWEAYY